MFRTGVPVKGGEFLDRKKHLPIFKQYINNNQPVMIKAPRRFGKTSLVKHVFEYEGGYSYIMSDLRRVVSLRRLATDIIDKAYALAGVEGFVKKSVMLGGNALLELFKRLQSIKIDGIGEVTLEQLNMQTDDTELFLGALDTADKIGAKLSVNIKIIFDEFQEILDLADDSVLDKLRAVAQHHENLTYVFLGSIESIMSKIFEKKSSPFFHFAQIMKLPPLDIDEVREAAHEAFGSIGISDFGSLDKMIEFYGGHPDYTMQALQLVYNSVVIDRLESVDDKLTDNTMMIVASNNDAYIGELISAAKKKRHHIDVLHSIANTVPPAIGSKSLYQVHTSLEDMGLITKEGQGNYVINDILLMAALKDETGLR